MVGSGTKRRRTQLGNSRLGVTDTEPGIVTENLRSIPQVETGIFISRVYQRDWS
jgi:hypothetical protein